MIKKVRRQDGDFPTRLNYANEKIGEIWMRMVKTTYYTTEDKIGKFQVLKGKTKINFYKNKSKYYDDMNIEMDEDPSIKNAQGINKNYHEVLLLVKSLQTKPQVKNMNIKYYDLYYTVIKNRGDKKFEDNQYEND